jgi:hypothetical protein
MDKVGPTEEETFMRTFLFGLTSRLIGGLVGVLALSQAAFSAPLTNSDDGISDEWEFIVAPYLWLASLDGDVTIGQIGVPVVMSTSQLLDNLDFAFAVRTELRKGRWGLLVDGQYLKLGASSDIETPGPILQPILDASIEQFLLESWAFYRTPIDRGYVDLYAGIRYTDFGLKMTFNPDLPLNPGFALDYSISPSWVSPIFGFRTGYDFSEKWYGLFRADIGGFGAGSSMTFSFNAGVGVKVSRIFDLTLSFRYLKDEYDEGTEGMPDYFEYDMETYGGMLGLVFNW